MGSFVPVTYWLGECPSTVLYALRFEPVAYEHEILLVQQSRGPSLSVHGIFYQLDYLQLCNGHPCLPVNSFYLQVANLKAIYKI